MSKTTSTQTKTQSLSSPKSKQYQLDDSVEKVPLVGPKITKTLKRLNISTVMDLFNYFPYRYIDTRRILTVEEAMREYIRVGQEKLPLVIKGQILELRQVRVYKRNMTITTALIGEIEASKSAAKLVKKSAKSKLASPFTRLQIIWYNQPYITTNFKKGDKIVVFGQLEPQGRGLVIKSPEYENYYPGKKLIHLGTLKPVYSETRGLSSKMIRRYLTNAKPWLDNIKDPFQAETIKNYNLLDLKLAYTQLHFPQKVAGIKKAIARLSLQELVEIMIRLDKIKPQEKADQTIEVKPLSREKQTQIQSFISSLPFKLTSFQQQALKDLETSLLNQRLDTLLCGDVGSGKTVVIFITVLYCLLNGYDVVLMAPTTILANQHYATIKNYLKEVNKGKSDKINLSLVTSKDKIIEATTKGPDLIIGTQALLFKEDLPDSVGLIIVDEQHKFGVNQRQKLLEKTSQEYSQAGQTNQTSRVKTKVAKKIPHLITMTATPIPRSLALTLYGFKDTVYIEGMPSGRKEPITKVSPITRWKQIANLVVEKVKKEKQQAFFVYPLIEESENLEAESALQGYKKLKEVYPELKIALLHGRMKDREKQAVINDFRQKKFQILVSTTVIEVGMDLPAVNMMVINNGERFGLAQLHQLRGRIGRGGEQGYCFILTAAKPQTSINRLKFFAQHNNGLKIAEYDLKYRGEGEVYGLKQSGLPQLKIARLTNLKMLQLATKIKSKLDLKNFPFYITKG